MVTRNIKDFLRNLNPLCRKNDQTCVIEKNKITLLHPNDIEKTLLLHYLSQKNKHSITLADLEHKDIFKESFNTFQKDLDINSYLPIYIIGILESIIKVAIYHYNQFQDIIKQLSTTEHDNFVELVNYIDQLLKAPKTKVDEIIKKIRELYILVYKQPPSGNNDNGESIYMSKKGGRKLTHPNLQQQKSKETKEYVVRIDKKTLKRYILKSRQKWYLKHHVGQYRYVDETKTRVKLRV